MINTYYLGIDTSNYTTSLAVVDSNGSIVANFKEMLNVTSGEKGLRQSDAVFSHVKNFPLLFKRFRELHLSGDVLAIGVSSRPRNQEGSYMPCFLVGVAEAAGIGGMLSAPVYEFSHQCGHIMAAICSSGSFDLLSGEHFCALHISGGTTELLDTKYMDNAFVSTIIGGTRDLNAGQLIDRIGVYMGLDFPCGKEMEILAHMNDKILPRRKAKADSTYINLSGIENVAKKIFDETNDKSYTSAFLFNYIGDAIAEMCVGCQEKNNIHKFVFAGGVMSNNIIREKLEAKFNCSFAEPELSRDNAVGIAYLTYLKHKSL